jgi:hypothetical protein
MDKHIEVKTVGDKVVVEVAGENDYMVLSPQLAAQIGKSMMDAACYLGLEIRVQAPKREVTTAQRNAMVVRAVHVMRSLERQPRLTKAKQIVDTLLEMLT